MEFLSALFWFVTGAAFGSFFTLVAYRLENGQSMTARSYCEMCHRPLSPIDLIPVLGYLFNKGRCRSCSNDIDWRYPVIEFFSGLGLMLFVSADPTWLQWFVFVYLLFLSTYDLLYFSVPKFLVNGGILISSIYMLWHVTRFLYSGNSIYMFFLNPDLIVYSIVILIFTVILGIFYLRHAVGLGDLLVIWIVLCIVFPDLRFFVEWFVILSLVGGIVGGLVVLLRSRKARVPYIPILWIAYVLAVVTNWVRL